MVKYSHKIYSLSISFIIVLASHNLFAQDTQQGLLWEIGKPGITPSCLFGTIHSEDPRVNKLSPIVRHCFEQANSVSLEVQLDVPTMLRAASAMVFTGTQSLEQLVDKGFYAQIVEALSQYNMPSMVVKKLKPWAVIAILSTPPMKTGEFLDLLLYKKARQLQIRTYGLEKVEEQLAVFEDLSLSDQITLLKETLKRLDEMPKIFDKLHQLYLNRDLTALMKFSLEYMRDNSENKALSEAFYKRIVDDRNVRMAKRMQKRLQEGNAFIAVGALHLPGEMGVLKLLQTSGYKVSSLY
jgi:uncharacterized protein